jgi:hypothetical protein
MSRKDNKLFGIPLETAQYIFYGSIILFVIVIYIKFGLMSALTTSTDVIKIFN